MKTNLDDLTTHQISKRVLRKIGAHCRKHRLIQRYWVETQLLRALQKEKGSGNRNRSPNMNNQQ